MTDQNEQQQVPASADHDPAPITPEAEVLHGEQARGEVFDQPEAVTLPADTRVAIPDTGETDDAPRR